MNMMPPQERGEVAKPGQQDRVRDNVPDGNIIPAINEEIGIRRKDIHEARQFRDAEQAEPGIVKEVINDMVEEC